LSHSRHELHTELLRGLPGRLVTQSATATFGDLLDPKSRLETFKTTGTFGIVVFKKICQVQPKKTDPLSVAELS
jgi:hypothetical protein